MLSGGLRLGLILAAARSFTPLSHNLNLSRSLTGLSSAFQPLMSSPSSTTLVLGITGPIASGKSTVGRTLGARREVAYIETDKLVTYGKGENLTREIVREFGCGLDDADDEVDRAALGRVVFGDRKKMRQLESLVWPAVKSTVKGLLETHFANEEIACVLLESAVLLDAGWDETCDHVWVVRSDPAVAIDRMVTNRGMSRDDAAGRLEGQKERKGLGGGSLEGIVRCDWTVIDNNGTEGELVENIQANFVALMQKWRQKQDE